MGVALLEQLIAQLGSVELDATGLVLEVDGRRIPADRIAIKLDRQRPPRGRRDDEEEEWEWRIALARARARAEQAAPRSVWALRRTASGTEPPPALRRGPPIPERARRALRIAPIRTTERVPPPLPPPPGDGER